MTIFIRGTSLIVPSDVRTDSSVQIRDAIGKNMYRAVMWGNTIGQ